MLVGKSTAEYLLVQAIIFTFSYIGLACFSYFLLALSIGGVRWILHPISIIIEVVGAIEILFYFLWSLPYRYYLHRQPPNFPAPLSRERRQDLFRRILATTSDLELFARKWMCWASLEDLRRENLKEWMLWALFDRQGEPGEDDEELEEYCDLVGQAMDRKILPGWGREGVKSIRLNFDTFAVSHRSLLFYMLVASMDMFTWLTLSICGFTFYRQPISQFLKTFPFRPMTLLCPKQSASPSMSYFYRPHKSSIHNPIVLVHGVGVGLSPYIPLLLMLPKDVGILAIEILPVSSRITPGLPLAADQMRELGDIVAQQDFDNFTLIGNSYGTFYIKLFIDSPYLSARMARTILLDPVAVLLHLPDLAYNFTRRSPVEANELELWWAAQTEPDIAFNLARRFCWREHLLWREDLLGCPTTLIIGEKDCVVDANAITAYITKGLAVSDGEEKRAGPALQWNWEDRKRWVNSVEEWKGEGLEVVWLEGYDHGQGFLDPRMLPKVANIITRFCRKQAKEV